MNDVALDPAKRSCARPAGSHTTSFSYRPEIDGLRCIAILAVLLYHLHLGPFSGGFVGVDIFFVISGYLITRLIRAEVVSTGSFNVGNFYLRRARRLFPAMFFTLMCCFIAGTVILAPTHFAEFAGSIVNAITSTSNLYFWSQNNYFDTASALKPLLHTWSLSVEEQFYLAWPWAVLLVSRFRTKWALVALAVVAAADLWIDLLLGRSPTTLFYITPFRIAEFAFGAAVVWIEDFPKPPALWVEILAAIGLLCAADAIMSYSDKMLFPSYNAILPCFGAALFIYAGKARYVGALLRNRAAVGIGLISYSLYLVHWPVLVFYTYSKDTPLSFGEKLGIAGFSIALATLMYFYVERPFRRQKEGSWSKPAFGLGCSLLAILLIAPAANAWANSGWLWRYPPMVAMQLSLPARENDHYVHLRKNELNDHPFDNDGRIKVLVVGDSMAGDLVNELFEAGLNRALDIRTLRMDSPCLAVPTAPVAALASDLTTHAPRCEKAAAFVLDAAPKLAPQIVILASDWRSWAFPFVSSTIKFFKSAGAQKVIIIGMKINSTSGIQFLSRYARRTDIASIRAPREPSTDAVNKRLQSIAESAGAEFYDPTDLNCTAGGCQMVGANDQMIFYDTKHLTRYGATVLGHKLKQKWSRQMFSLAAASAPPPSPDQ